MEFVYILEVKVYLEGEATLSRNIHGKVHVFRIQIEVHRKRWKRCADPLERGKCSLVLLDVLGVYNGPRAA